jgi:hypothetical protein
MYCTDQFSLKWLLLLPLDLHMCSLQRGLHTRQLCVVSVSPHFPFYRNRLISPERHTDPSQQILWFWNLPEMSEDSLSGQNCLN